MRNQRSVPDKLKVFLILTIFSAPARSASISEELLINEESSKPSIKSDSVIELDRLSKSASVGAISGPQIFGDKESVTRILTFLQGLLIDNKGSAQIKLKHEGGRDQLYSLKHHYGPYHFARVKSWYSDTGSLAKEKFVQTVDNVLKNPLEECTIIIYQDYLVCSLLAGRSMNLYAGREVNYYYFYDLKLSALDLVP